MKKILSVLRFIAVVALSCELLCANPMFFGLAYSVPVGGSPAFGAEIQRGTQAFTIGATYAVVLTAGVSAGTVLGIVAPYDAGVTIDGTTPTTDSKSNTYSLDKDAAAPGGERVAIIHGLISSGLSSGDIITIHYSASQNMWRGAILFNMTNLTPTLDVTGLNNDFGTAVTVSVTTSAATVMIGAISTTDTGATLSAVDGTQSGAAYNAGNRIYLVYKNNASSGAGQTIGATLGSSANWAIATAEYK